MGKNDEFIEISEEKIKGVYIFMRDFLVHAGLLAAFTNLESASDSAKDFLDSIIDKALLAKSESTRALQKLNNLQKASFNE